MSSDDRNVGSFFSNWLDSLKGKDAVLYADLTSRLERSASMVPSSKPVRRDRASPWRVFRPAPTSVDTRARDDRARGAAGPPDPG